MSRSGYTDDGDDGWRWRGTVANAIKGRRGQAFFLELIAALDALPEKKLIKEELEIDGAVCALGAVGKARGIDMTGIDPEDSGQVSAAFRISNAIAVEIEFMNDECFSLATEKERFSRMRSWAVSCLKK